MLFRSLAATTRVTGPILWANTHLLFWLSLTPFAAAWLGENHFAAKPTALYGVTLTMSAIAYFILQTVIIRSGTIDPSVVKAFGRDAKGKLSIAAYLVAVALTLVTPWISLAIYALVALVWLIPDRRIEATIANP